MPLHLSTLSCLSVSIGGSSECHTAGINTYLNWPQLDWSGDPSHANKGDTITYNGVIYKTNWWTRSIPGCDGKPGERLYLW